MGCCLLRALLLLTSGAMGLAVGPLRAQDAASTVPVLVALPDSLFRSEALPSRVEGATLQVLAVPPERLETELPSRPGPCVLLDVPLAILQRLAAQGRLAPWRQVAGDWRPATTHFALHRRSDYVVAWRADAVPAVAPTTWEGLALQPELRGRLGLCPPSVDPMPWIDAMLEAYRGGRGEDYGIALWTTLDARLAAPLSSHDALHEALRSGQLAAAVLPRDLVQADATLRLTSFEHGGPDLLVGDAVYGAGADELMFVAVAALRQRPALVASPAASGSGRPDLRHWPLPAPSDRWLLRHGQEVLGRGASVEAVADWLDLVFGLLFLLVLFLIWRHLRKHDVDDANTELR